MSNPNDVITTVERVLEVSEKIVDTPVKVIFFAGFLGMSWLCYKLNKLNKAQAERIGFLREEYIIVSQEAQVDAETIRIKLKQFDEK